MRDRNNISTTHVTVVRQGDEILSVVRPGERARSRRLGRRERADRRRRLERPSSTSASSNAWSSRGRDARAARLLEQLGQACSSAAASSLRARLEILPRPPRAHRRAGTWRCRALLSAALAAITRRTRVVARVSHRRAAPPRLRRRPAARPARLGRGERRDARATAASSERQRTRASSERPSCGRDEVVERARGAAVELEEAEAGAAAPRPRHEPAPDQPRGQRDRLARSPAGRSRG